MNSANLIAVLEGLDCSSPDEMASEIVYLAGRKTVLLYSEKLRLYFEYDAAAKENLDGRRIFPGLKLGGSRDVKAQPKNG